MGSVFVFLFFRSTSSKQSTKKTAGVNEDGQLGLDPAADVLSPKVVEALLGTRLRSREFNRCPLVAGSRCTLALDASGRALSWGWNARGTLGHGSNKRGSNSNNNSNSNSSSSSLSERKPRRISALSGTKIVQAATGGWHCLALDAGGGAWAWVRVFFLLAFFVSSSSSSLSHTHKIKLKFVLPFFQGGNEYSQCGSDPSLTGRDVRTPVRCVPHLKLKQVAAGGMNSAFLTEDGDVWTCGEPWGDFSVVVSRAPRQVPLPPLLSSSSGFGAGAGATPSPSPPPLPQQPSSSVPSPSPSPFPFSRPKAAKLACGAFHTLALLECGEVLAWG